MFSGNTNVGVQLVSVAKGHKNGIGFSEEKKKKKKRVRKEKEKQKERRRKKQKEKHKLSPFSTVKRRFSFIPSAGVHIALLNSSRHDKQKKGWLRLWFWCWKNSKYTFRMFSTAQKNRRFPPINSDPRHLFILFWE